MLWRKLTASVVTGALILGTGAAGVVLTSRANAKAESLHRLDREDLQNTLAGLGTQYLLFALKDETQVAFNGPWSLRPGDPADTARLQGYVTQSALLNYGAAVVDFQSHPLNVYTSGGPLPAADDPGYQPLVAALKNGKPGLSSVMRAGSVPVLALGVPVLVGGSPKAVFLGYFRADKSPLETYVAGLHFQGHTGRTYVVDASGMVVAATNPAEVGTHLAAGPALGDLLHGKKGFREFRQNGQGMVASFAPIAVGGWGAITTQASGEFFGPIRQGHQRIELALIALLAVASLVIVILGYKREAARRHYQERLAYQAHHDTLTDLPNRAMFNNRLSEALSRARRQQHGVALLYIDLDGFKNVNDTLGHGAGDALLVEVADRLGRSLRHEDTLARIGGDEFTAIMEDLTDVSQAIRIAERVIAETSRPFDLEGNSAKVSASVGIAYSAEGRDSAEGLLREADLAMYGAKDGGKARYRVYERSEGGPATAAAAAPAEI